MSTSSDESDSSDNNHKARDDDDSSDVDSDASSEIITSFVPSRPIKPLPRRASTQPKIVMLDDGDKS